MLVKGNPIDRGTRKAAFASGPRGNRHAPETGAFGQNASYAYAKRGGEVFCPTGENCGGSKNPGFRSNGIMLAKLKMPYMGKTLTVFPGLFCAPDWAIHRVFIMTFEVDDQRFGFARVLSVAIAREELLSREIGLAVFHLN